MDEVGRNHLARGASPKVDAEQKVKILTAVLKPGATVSTLADRDAQANGRC